MSSSLVMPRNFPAGRPDNSVVATDRMVGNLDWGAEKNKILDYFDSKAPAWRDMRWTMNSVVVATWIRPGQSKGGIIFADATRDEDRYQGASGIVIGMGPQAYADSDRVVFDDDDKCKIGDWVFFRRSDGLRFDLCGWPCIQFPVEYGIRCVLPQPDLVY